MQTLRIISGSRTLDSKRERSPEARDFAEAALVRLALAMGPHSCKLVIIGGLNPGFLTVSPPVPHLGTTDIDVLLEVGFVYDRDEMDFAWLEEGLRVAAFTPNPSGYQPWRWYMRIDDRLVKLELICDAYDSPGHELALPGCATVVAQNLKGPRPALLDAVERRLEVSSHALNAFPDAPSHVIVRFAGLGGYVMSKAAAVVLRGDDKDFYDLTFVLLFHGAGGATGAARAVHGVMKLDDAVSFNSLVTAALDMFSKPESRPARAFAEQMQLSGDATDPQVLAQDAVGAAIACRRELATLGH